ncbi:hypothetical protein AKI39_09780 [Bordetella sp. H567]|uniref:I78 family peptidase inhibitor n=1 Tax=Bordetella sp. H567 TaxID=1697043 RepID=UPI00081D2B87|nr:I78 family peptidase inhibitor [Bordetella sp. H567]AOB30917.1 hypothetical protein AKI39_09780 [Bordetella sp. H567]
MIRKLIPLVLVASLAACANTGRQASSTGTDGTTSSTPSAGTTDSSSSTESYGASGDSAGGSYGGGYGGGGYTPSYAASRGCDAQPVQNMIGTKLTSSVESQIKQASSSSKTRVLKPGEVMTMEYDPQRINLILDQQGALTALRCG